MRHQVTAVTVPAPRPDAPSHGPPVATFSRSMGCRRLSPVHPAEAKGNCMVSQYLHSPAVLLPPGMLLSGRYRLQRELGRGRAAVVYLAHDRTLDAPVAVRVSALTAPEQARHRREVLAAWDIAHDHIVRVHGCFEEGERSFVVMDYVAGPDLGRRVAESGPLTVDETAAVGRGIALALRAAHRRGILHRHVSPGNIMLGPETRACLGDFGSAGVGAGPETGRDFLAPEVVSGQAADTRADIYSLGMCLFFALTGRLPERQDAGRPPAPVANGHRPARLLQGIPEWMDAAIAAATAALPADRFASAGRLAEALTPGTGTPDYSPPRTPMTVPA